ncbi:MAG: hypothetical protein ACREVL_10645 [Solimonas sp.]
MKQKEKRAARLCAIVAAISSMAALPAQAAPGDPLGPVVTVATAAPTEQLRGLAIARGADGRAVVAWASTLGIFARRLDAAGAPSGPDFLVDPQPTWAVPDVTMNATGAFVVGWARSLQNETDRGVYARRYAADGTPQSGVLQVAGGFPSNDRLSDLGNAAVAMDDDGDFTVAWSQGRIVEQGSPISCAYGAGLCAAISGHTIRLRRYTEGGGQAGNVQTVDTAVGLVLRIAGVGGALGSEERSVAAAMAPDGRFVVAWSRIGQGLLSSSGVYARRYDANGGAELKRTVSLQTQAYPVAAVAMSAGGAYAVVYDRRVPGTGSVFQGNYKTGIYMRQFPAGIGLGGAEQRVDDGSDQYVASQDVAMDAAGDCVVTWTGNTTTTDRRGRAQRYADGGGAMGINFTTDNIGVRVAMTPAGNFAFVWNDDATAIRARFYDGP